MVKLKIKKLNPDVKIPNYSHEGDAGLDLYSIEDCILKPGERRGVHTGISIALPKGHVALVWDKSGIAKKGITTIAGVLDSNYRGEYIIMLFNIGTEDYEIKKGQKIAQILIPPVVQPQMAQEHK
jgi:dUTP pyrophosphatase